jgi:hypothetical protein
MSSKGWGEIERRSPKTHRELVAIYRERSRPVPLEEVTPFFARISRGFRETTEYSSSHLDT